MEGLKGFHVTLRDRVSVDDKDWSFQVPDLPKPTKANDRKLVKSITFTSSTKEQHIKLRLEPAPSNRVTWSEPLDRFLLLSFANFRLREPSNEDGKEVTLAPARDSAEYIGTLLKKGIKLNEVHYFFFGHSNSQLKSRSCFMFAATKEEIAQKIAALGEFSGMKTVAKKAKRIGLLFSSAEMATNLDPERCEDIDDVDREDYCFTDGCGLLSKQLARLIVQRKDIVFRNQRYLPSVFQIRYRGYKGVLTVDPSMQGKIQAKFRRSMKKFTAHSDFSLSVVEYSKPYTFGFLNDEIVLLLSALGVGPDQLLSKQQQYLNFLDQVYDCEVQLAFQFLSCIENTKLAEKMLMDGIEAVADTLRGLVRQEQAKMLNKHGEQRCRILIRKSRLVFGVCDPSASSEMESGRLKPGTCFVRVTLDGDGQAKTLINTEVLVTRNPCLHPGDLQKFRTVDVPEWSHLVDCIVFPTAGKRPSADLMSGGDLDGDKFFVTWDPDVIPRKVSKPALYPGVKERTSFEAITDNDRAEFFAKYNNMSLGRVKKLYLKWARVAPTSAMSSECQQLNRLFSQCVDGNRIKVPPVLEDPPEPSPETPPFILDMLHDAATAHIRSRMSKDYSVVSTLPEDDIDQILAHREALAFSEYELIQLVLRKCGLDGLRFADYAPFFNFDALTEEQRAWLLSQIPPIKGMPALIQNGLLQSDLVAPQELSRFRLDDSRLHWKSVFRSGEDRMARFLNAATRSLELFHKKLIIMQADERLTLMIYIPEQTPRATEVEVGDRIRVFALPRSSGLESANYRVTPTKSTSRLYSDDNTFQLYEAKRANTFIFLTRGPKDKGPLRNAAGPGDRRRQAQQLIDSGLNFDNRASVALNKISGPIQKHVGRMNRAGILKAEIYVISNRDIESMRVADQWLYYVDSEEMLPLFEPISRKYSIPALANVDRAELSSVVSTVALDGDLAGLQSLTDAGEIRTIFELLVHAKERTRLYEVCAEVLNLAALRTTPIDQTTLSKTIVQLLPSAPFLTNLVLDSDLWSVTKDALAAEGEAVLESLCKELILEANRMEGLVRKPLARVLQELKHMPMQLLAELVELVALTVERPESALDLLLECIQPECPRLILATPRESQRSVKSLVGIALDHIEESTGARSTTQQTFDLVRDGVSEGYEVVKAMLRIDAPGGHPKTGDHVVLVSHGRPVNAPLEKPYAAHALVISSGQGVARFRCLHHLPSFAADCAWKLRHCGSFVTSKAMLDAVTALYASKAASCRIYRQIIGVEADETSNTRNAARRSFADPDLNPSQTQALNAAAGRELTLLWGPPGTGKTFTIVRILKQLLTDHPDHRFLVTAPTHNAVDNLMQRFIHEGGHTVSGQEPLRVSTDFNKVAAALKRYTCDAMVGKDLSDGFAGRHEAQKRVQEAVIIFTTCAGAGLGLLRSQQFSIVIVDEASQITEPGSLVPLTKGCSRAILVGDHVQLRPSAIGRHAVLMDFNVSLFERLYTAPDRDDVAKVMLDTQYRMHPDLCAFSSDTFYEGNLQTAKGLDALKLPRSQFPWPSTGGRKVFVQCDDVEDLGRQSKSNQGQVRLCKKICKLLDITTASSAHQSSTPAENATVAILTPYSRQRELLRNAIPNHAVSSIDGFQGREADIAIFVTVRSNAHHDIGFLSDMRRLNVVMTRARAGVIVIGHRNTLMQQSDEGADEESKSIWRGLLSSCEQVVLGGEE